MLSFPPLQPTGAVSTVRNTAAHPTLWQFEPKSRMWTHTTLPVRPSHSNSPVALPRRWNFAWWSDSTGALFIFGGGGDTAGFEHQNTSASPSDDVWRFDPHSLAWNTIQPAAGRRSGSNELQTEFQQWPSLRMAHVMWCEERPYASTDVLTERGEQVTWMFGGVPVNLLSPSELPTLVTAADDVSTQLWQFSYHYNGTGIDRWKWLLVTEQAHDTNQHDYSSQEQQSKGEQPEPLRPSPVTACFDNTFFSIDPMDQRNRQCPLGRILAGAWKRATDPGGWLFGGRPWGGSDSVRWLTLRGLSDLWRFNGNSITPVWTQYLPDSDSQTWPPSWSAAVGWAASTIDSSATVQIEKEDDQDEELWLATGSGTIWGVGDPTGVNMMWRFNVASCSWEQLSSQGALLPRRIGAAAIPVSGGHGGVLFGGLGTRGCRHDEDELLPVECSSESSAGPGCVSTSMLWSWHS